MTASRVGTGSARWCWCWGTLAGLALALTACGGGDGGGGGVADAPPATTPPALPGGRVSGDTPVAAGCTGGDTVGTPYTNAEVEPYLAQSPLQPDHLVAVWQQDRWSDGAARAMVSAVSFDGGRSWVPTWMFPVARACAR